MLFSELRELDVHKLCECKEHRLKTIRVAV